MSEIKQSEVGKIQTLLLKRPQEAYVDQAHIERQWRELNYPALTNLEVAIQEYEAFLDILKKHVPEIWFLPQNDETGLDSIYVHDPAIICSKGAIILNMGKPQRRGEPKAMKAFLESKGFPIYGEIHGEGTMEGGDTVWIDEKTLAVGVSYRTNEEGIRQLKEMAQGLFEVVPVPLPHWNGPDECLHIMSFISPVDKDLAVVYSKQMPVPFRKLLLEKGYDFVEVPDSEYDTMAPNVLAIAPRVCLMIEGNPITKKRLEEKGATVYTFKGEQICWNGAGGPTCLTRPLIRL